MRKISQNSDFKPFLKNILEMYTFFLCYINSCYEQKRKFKRSKLSQNFTNDPPKLSNHKIYNKKCKARKLKVQRFEIYFFWSAQMTLLVSVLFIFPEFEEKSEIFVRKLVPWDQITMEG